MHVCDLLDLTDTSFGPKNTVLVLLLTCFGVLSFSGGAKGQMPELCESVKTEYST